MGKHQKCELELITKNGEIIDTNQGECYTTEKLEKLAKDIMDKKAIKRISWR